MQIPLKKYHPKKLKQLNAEHSLLQKLTPSEPSKGLGNSKFRYAKPLYDLRSHMPEKKTLKLNPSGSFYVSQRTVGGSFNQ